MQRWDCSDSDTDFGLLIDYGSDSGSDTKYKISNTSIVERVSAVQEKEKKRDTSY